MRGATLAGAGASASGAPTASLELPSDSRIFWTIYGLAWIPYGGGYLVLALTSDCTSLGTAATLGGMFTGPAALVGVGAVTLTRYWDWPPDRPLRFGLVHLAGALAFSFVWLVAVDLLFALRRLAEGGSFRLVWFRNELFRWHLLAGLLLYGTIVTVTYLARTGRRLQQERERAARSEALRVQAQIEAIESRLNPHFLFNSLHSALSLIRRAPERAERAMERLGDLLRYAVGADEEAGTEEVTLDRELEMVRTYLELERLRLGDRLEVREEIDVHALGVRLPPLTVQPLVENAVRHGIAEAPEGGTLELVATLEGGEPGEELVITVRDDGPGAEPEAVRSAEGMGLALVRERLGLLYGDGASLEIDTRPGEGFEARVRIPLGDEPAAETGEEAA